MLGEAMMPSTLGRSGAQGARRCCNVAGGIWLSLISVLEVAENGAGMKILYIHGSWCVFCRRTALKENVFVFGWEILSGWVSLGVDLKSSFRAVDLLERGESN
jgi:hypothetical protein